MSFSFYWFFHIQARESLVPSFIVSPLQGSIETFGEYTLKKKNQDYLFS
jgi:hypothetical protein